MERDESRPGRSDHLIHMYSCTCPSRPSIAPGHLAWGWFRRLMPRQPWPTRPGPDSCPRTESPVMHRQRSRTPPRCTRGERRVGVRLSTELHIVGRPGLWPNVPGSRLHVFSLLRKRISTKKISTQASADFARRTVAPLSSRKADVGRPHSPQRPDGPSLCNRLVYSSPRLR